MTNPEEDMRRLKRDAAQEYFEDEQRQLAAHREQAISQQHVKHLFRQIANNLVCDDDSLTVVETQTPGFQIHYIQQGQHNPTPFSVTATLKGANVDIQISDGQWDNVPNVSGNWGHWTDAKSMYSGNVDEVRISDVICRAFLTWYKSSLQ